MTAVFTITALNDASESENRMHSDEVAARYGFFRRTGERRQRVWLYDTATRGDTGSRLVSATGL
jgi:hypothetical protein